jgi:DNA replication protein DnaC
LQSAANSATPRRRLKRANTAGLRGYVGSVVFLAAWPRSLSGCHDRFDLATSAFIGKREDALFLGPGGTGKSHLAQAIGHCAIQQGYKVLYRETHILLDELAEAVADGTRREYMESVATVPLLIIDDFGMRKLPLTAAEDLLEIIMRRYERCSTLLTSNRPVEDWGKLLGDAAAVSAMLDRLLQHGHVLKCGPRSWRTKSAAAS